MATYSKQFLSASTSGTPIAITSTDSAGAQTIHTAPSTSTDEITLYAYNKHTAAVALSLDIGTTTAPMTVSIPSKSGQVLVHPALPLTGNQVLKGFCSTVSTAALYVVGYVNRIS